MVQLKQMETLTNAQWLVSIAEMPGIYWTTASAVELTMERADWVDPIAGLMRKTASGSISYNDITISKSFDTLTDWDLISQLDGYLKNGDYLSGSMSPVKRVGGLELLGNRRIDLENLRVSSFTAPGEIDVASGTTAATLSVTLSVEFIKFENTRTSD